MCLDYVVYVDMFQLNFELYGLGLAHVGIVEPGVGGAESQWVGSPSPTGAVGHLWLSQRPVGYRYADCSSYSSGRGRYADCSYYSSGLGRHATVVLCLLPE